MATASVTVADGTATVSGIASSLTTIGAPDAHADDLTARAAYDDEAAGFRVLVADTGSGLAGLFIKNSASSADWSDEFRYTGPAGATGSTGATGATGAAGADGADGADGESFVWQGAWSLAIDYVVGETVKHNGQSYICVADHTSAAGTEPSVGVDWATVWDLMAAAGDMLGSNNLSELTDTDAALANLDATPFAVNFIKTEPRRDYPIPEDYGTVGVGSDDDNAIQDLITAASGNEWVIGFRNGVNYVAGTSIWLGSDDAQTGIGGIIGYGASITGKMTGAPIFDAVGIRNVGRTFIKGLELIGDESSQPDCGLLMGRPEQAVGVVSSGRIHLEDFKIKGWYDKVAAGIIQSETNYLERVTFERENGLVLALSSHNILSLSSPNVSIGIEENSTSTLFTWKHLWCNNKSASADDPVVLIHGWGVGTWDGGLVNRSAAGGDLIAIMPNVAETRNIYQLNISSVMMHGTHRYSFAVGDPDNAGGSIKQCRFIGNGHAGNATCDFKVVSTGLAIYSSKVIVDEHIDLGDADCYDWNEFEVNDNASTSFTASGTIEGVLRCLPDTTRNITSSAGESKLEIDYATTGMKSYPARSECTISSGEIIVSRLIHTVDTEGDAAGDVLDTIYFYSDTDTPPTNGQLLKLKMANAGRKVTLSITGGNIRGVSNVVLDNVYKWVLLMYDEVSAIWIIIGFGSEDFTPELKDKLDNINSNLLAANATAVNNSTTLASVGVSFDVEAGEVYTFTLQCLYDTVSGAGFAVKLLNDAGTLTGDWAPADGANSISSSSITSTISTTATGTTNRSLTLMGWLTCDADATITLQYAQASATSGDTTLKRGTSVRTQKVT